MANYLKTSDIAKEIGVHVNTVRLYESYGFLSSVPRSPSGYRLFTQLHLEQMRLARLALTWPYIGKKQVIVDLIQCAADGDMGMAMELAYEHLINVRIERTHAEAAIEFLERWAQGQMLDTTQHSLNIGATAQHLGVSVDQLRNWDRSGLIDVPRDPTTHYRIYRATEIGRLRVIRILRQSGYSVMAILRMLRQFDTGEKAHLREALDTPGDNEYIETIADRWLTTLKEQEERAQEIIRQITVLINLTIDASHYSAETD
ncbi:MerR family transcriptional regulator [Phototrophicus methaneseepsis]|uniref:MerR family transcriptional regulator n=1 Tax=Phototrophicus methaneseepsis TaxID=2710758 RepID=A0A7S8ECP9_9CHLR|nr:MerR family transcriptional regulator [Phototrophicus methaneseepsis]QPC84562.1 MerR family transcriptional regulator [Phototrophicus methaneseepsis]